MNTSCTLTTRGTRTAVGYRSQAAVPCTSLDGQECPQMPVEWSDSSNHAHLIVLQPLLSLVPLVICLMIVGIQGNSNAGILVCLPVLLHAQVCHGPVDIDCGCIRAVQKCLLVQGYGCTVVACSARSKQAELSVCKVHLIHSAGLRHCLSPATLHLSCCQRNTHAMVDTHQVTHQQGP